MIPSSIRKVYQGVADRRQMFRMFDRHAQWPNRAENDSTALYSGEWFEIAQIEHDYMFGAPVRSEKNGKSIFTVPILDRPSTTPTDGGLHYTLTSSAGAVEGVLPFP